jgi:hypothetical protein
MAAFRERFNKAPPCRVTLLDWEKRVFALGSVKERSMEWEKDNYSKNAPTYVTEDMEANPFVCPASRFTYGFTGHVTKTYVSDSNQIKIGRAHV